MLPASNTIVGVDFGAPRRARDQRRKIIAIAAHAVADRQYRVDAIGTGPLRVVSWRRGATLRSGVPLLFADD